MIQSRPIKMRASILYLANRWMDSKMLLTPNRFSYLVILLLVAFHWIPQFIAQFCSICPFVCPPLPLRLNCINLRDRAEAAAAHLCPCVTVQGQVGLHSKNFNYSVKFVSSQIYFHQTFQLESSKGTGRTFRRNPGRAAYNNIKIL